MVMRIQVLLLNINYNRLHVVDVAQFILHRLLHGHDLVQRNSVIDRQVDNRVSNHETRHNDKQMRTRLSRENVLNLNVISHFSLECLSGRLLDHV